MSLRLTTDADPEIPAGKTTKALISYEGFSGGVVTNDFFKSPPIEELSKQGTGVIAAETSSPIIGSTSGSYDDAEATWHRTPTFSNTPPYDVYLSGWFDNIDRTLDDSRLLQFWHSGGIEFGVHYDGNAGGIDIFTRGGYDKEGVSVVSGPLFIELFGQHDIPAEGASGRAVVRVNNTNRYEIGWLGMKAGNDHHIGIGGSDNTGGRGTFLADNILIEFADQDQNLALPTWSTYLYNGGNGRTKQEILDNVLV